MRLNDNYIYYGVITKRVIKMTRMRFSWECEWLERKPEHKMEFKENVEAENGTFCEG